MFFLNLVFGLLQAIHGSLVLSPSPNQSLKPPIDQLQISRFLSSGDSEFTPADVRLCQQRPHSRASLWSRQPNTFSEWQVQVAFRVVGDKSGGGEGMAFWYARNLGQAGPVYGGPNKWNGLGVFVDVEGESTEANHRVMGALNGGDMEWKMDKKGEGQFFGGCLAQIRNTALPVFMRVTYVNRVLKVELDDSKQGANYASCMERANTDLPPGMFFGFSASTSDHPDAFEVSSFEVFQLKREEQADPGHPPNVHNPNQHPNQQQQQQQQQQHQGNQQQNDALSKHLQNMQSNFNAVIGKMMPGDRNLMQRMDQLEESIKAIGDRINNLSDLLGKVVSKSATVDPSALLHTLNDIRDSTRNQLQALTQKAGAAEQQTQQLARVITTKPASSSSIHFWWWLGFAAAQITLLLAYQVIKKNFEDKSKKFI